MKYLVNDKMNNIFENVKIRKIVLIYIGAILLTLVILQIPLLKKAYLNNKYWGELILNSLVLAWFYFLFCKQSVSVKSRFISSIKVVNYKKVFKLYLLNLGFYIGAGLCIFIGDMSETKLPSYLFIIFGITLAPIIEEFIFRGVIMSRLKIKFGIIPAIFVNAIIFAVMHFDLNIIGRLFFGVIISILYIQTKNIMNCVILHILNNGSVFLFPVIYQYTNFSINTDNGFMTGLELIIIYCCFILSIILNVHYIKNNLPLQNRNNL